MVLLLKLFWQFKKLSYPAFVSELVFVPAGSPFETYLTV
jgi:hypothetical protein